MPKARPHLAPEAGAGGRRDLFAIKYQILVPHHDPRKRRVRVVVVIPVVPHVGQRLVIDSLAIVFDIDWHCLVLERVICSIHDVVHQPGVVVVQVRAVELVRSIQSLRQKLTFDVIGDQVGAMKIHFVEPVSSVSGRFCVNEWIVGSIE